MISITRLAAPVLVAAALLAGCGDDDEAGEPAARTAATERERAPAATARTDRTATERAEDGDEERERPRREPRRENRDDEERDNRRAKPGTVAPIPPPQDDSAARARAKELRECLKRERNRDPDARKDPGGAFAKCLKLSRKELRAQFLRGCRELARRRKDREALRRCEEQARRFSRGAAGDR